MAWVAFDRAAIVLEAEGLKDPARRWRQVVAINIAKLPELAKRPQ
jgi:hypothetical protein